MNYWRTKFIVSFDVEQAGDGVCAVVGRLSLVRSQQSNRNRNTKEKERNIFIRKEMSIKVNCVCSRASPFNPASDPSGPFPFPCALGRAERDPSRTTAFSLFLHSARRASYLFTKIHNKPRHRRETDTTHSNRSEFFSIRRPVRHRNFFFSLS